MVHRGRGEESVFWVPFFSFCLSVLASLDFFFLVRTYCVLKRLSES
jgi:hypothetical protein